MDQATIDYFSRRIAELIDGIDKGDFSKEIIPDKYKWEHLLGLFLLRDSIDGADELFVELFDLAIQSGIKYLKRKAKEGKVINVAFQSYSAAQWPAEGVYKTFEKHPNINTYVIISPLTDRNKESRDDTYKQSFSWFKDNGYKVVEGYEPATEKIADWNTLGGYPDVLYQLSSWFSSMPESQWFSLLPLRCLVAYIPYGIYLADNKGGSYSTDIVYNKEFMNLLWRVYCDSVYNLEGYRKYQLIKGKNVRYCGYSKMDYFYEKKEFTDEDIAKIWKAPEGKAVKDMKRIIIAPHYSAFDDGILLYSTFHKNMWFWPYLVKKYRDKVTFIFKPHPNLRNACVEHKVFKSFDEYDAYLELWNNMPNGKVVQEADYLNIFATSDAMIMDSGSFIGEYLYTGKPLLYLTRPEQTFMEIGKKILDTYYKTPGENYDEIDSFIQDVVLNGNDPMKGAREKVFEEELDYKKNNGQLASEYICNDLLDIIGK